MSFFVVLLRYTRYSRPMGLGSALTVLFLVFQVFGNIYVYDFLYLSICLYIGTFMSTMDKIMSMNGFCVHTISFMDQFSL